MLLDFLLFITILLQFLGSYLEFLQKLVPDLAPDLIVFNYKINKFDVIFKKREVKIPERLSFSVP